LATHENTQADFADGFFLHFRMTHQNKHRTEYGFTTNFHKSHVPKNLVVIVAELADFIVTIEEHF